MKLTIITLFCVLIGLLSSMVFLDVDHFIIINGVNGEAKHGISFAPIKCMWYGFLSITSQETKVCQESKEYGSRLLHDWRVGLFLLGFVISYYVVIKNKGDG